MKESGLPPGDVGGYRVCPQGRGGLPLGNGDLPPGRGSPSSGKGSANPSPQLPWC